MKIILRILAIIILVVLLPVAFVLILGLFLLWRQNVILAYRFSMLYINITFELPTMWMTRHEIHARIGDKYGDKLAELEATPGIEKFVEGNGSIDLIHIEIGRKIDEPPENSGGINSSDLPLRERIIQMIVDLTFDHSSDSEIREYERAYFHPSPDRIMLNATGVDNIGRTFRLPSPALCDDDNRLAQSGESVEIDFVRRKSFGKKSPPKPDAATERQNTPGSLEPLRT